MAAAKWLFPPPGGPNRMRLAPFSSHPSPEVMAVTCARETIGTASKAKLSSVRSEEHTSELQSLMRISYAVFCLKKKKHTHQETYHRSYLSSTASCTITLVFISMHTRTLLDCQLMCHSFNSFL